LVCNMLTGTRTQIGIPTATCTLEYCNKQWMVVAF
jgi:hypothetical protein